MSVSCLLYVPCPRTKPDPGLCPDPEWNQWPFPLLDGAHPTGLHWSGLFRCFNMKYAMLIQKYKQCIYLTLKNRNKNKILVCSPLVRKQNIPRIFETSLCFAHVSFFGGGEGQRAPGCRVEEGLEVSNFFPFLLLPPGPGYHPFLPDSWQ